MSELPEISILIPLYRGRDTVKACIDSLVAQEGVTVEILLLDNGCPEDTGEWAGYHLSHIENPPEWKLLEVPENTGFAAGMNRLYRDAASPWICFMNQDVVINPDHLSRLVKALDDNKSWAGVCGTLYRSDSRTGKRVIDTTGHVIFRDRIVRNRGAGMKVKGRSNITWDAGEVFGLSAACSLYHREALESAREEEGPYDPDFFAYFEDIDLDYRLRRAGWELGWVPDAEGTHALAGSGGRKELSVRLRAYGNRRRIMWKHETIESLLPDLGPIIVQDVYASIRALFTDPVAWLAGPWIFLASFTKVLERRRRLDKLLGTDRTWIRKWLRPQSERMQRQ